MFRGTARHEAINIPRCEANTRRPTEALNIFAGRLKYRVWPTLLPASEHTACLERRAGADPQDRFYFYYWAHQARPVKH